MNRRHFLGSLAALSAGMALDVDKLLWVPGRRTYFDIVRPSEFAFPVVYGEISDEDDFRNCVDYRYTVQWIPVKPDPRLLTGRLTIPYDVWGVT